MPDEKQESGFLIDGTRYEIPTLDTITLDEERILYIYSDTVLQDFAPAHPEAEENVKRAVDVRQAQKVRNPDFKRALAHIAYKRAHPDEKDAEINKAIGLANALEVDVAMVRGDDSPPDQSSQTPLESKSDTRTPSTSSDSGSPTENDSATVVDLPARTGTGG